MKLYNVNEKELIGRYSKYCRLKQNINIKKICQLLNCSYKTYKDIEHGLTKKNDDYYDALVDYFDIKLHINYKNLEICFKMLPSLYDAVENLDIKQIEDITNNLQQRITKIEEYAYYKELNQSIKYIIKHFIKNEYLTVNEIYETIHLIDLWNNELSSILIEICEKSNLNVWFDTGVSDVLYKIITNNDSISKYWYAKESAMHANYSIALDLYDELISYFKEKNNYKRQVTVMLRKFAIYRDIDLYKAKEYIIVLNDLLDDKRLPDNLVNNINHSIAMFYYLHNVYDAALEYFNNSFQKNQSLVTLLYIYACESRLNKLKDKKIYNRVKTNISPYIEYFEMKADNTSFKELEKYIINELLSLLSKETYKEPLWSMFEYEISQLVDKTRNYKSMKIFYEKMQSSIRSAL